jgi:hypothetical protein
MDMVSFTSCPLYLLIYRIEGWVGPEDGLDVIRKREIFDPNRESNREFHAVQPAA